MKSASQRASGRPVQLEVRGYSAGPCGGAGAALGCRVTVGAVLPSGTMMKSCVLVRRGRTPAWCRAARDARHHHCHHCACRAARVAVPACGGAPTQLPSRRDGGAPRTRSMKLTKTMRRCAAHATSFRDRVRSASAAPALLLRCRRWCECDGALVSRAVDAVEAAWMLVRCSCEPRWTSPARLKTNADRRLQQRRRRRERRSRQQWQRCGRAASPTRRGDVGVGAS